MLHVYKSECDWVVAESLEDAYAVNIEHCGITREDMAANDDGFGQLADDSKLTIAENENDDGGRTGEKVSKTCAEWAAEFGRGHLCSTEY